VNEEALAHKRLSCQRQTNQPDLNTEHSSGIVYSNLPANSTLKMEAAGSPKTPSPIHTATQKVSRPTREETQFFALLEVVKLHSNYRKWYTWL